jgi:hypothetical protein
VKSGDSRKNSFAILLKVKVRVNVLRHSKECFSHYRKIFDILKYFSLLVNS